MFWERSRFDCSLNEGTSFSAVELYGGEYKFISKGLHVCRPELSYLVWKNMIFLNVNCVQFLAEIRDFIFFVIVSKIMPLALYCLIFNILVIIM